MSDLRPAAVAGSWYPASADRLGYEVDRYVAAAEPAQVVPPKAIVAPHAGLRYSGPVAAFAYKAVRDARYGAMVLVGPSHYVGFEGVSIWPRGAWQTPFGPVRVDETLAGRIADASPAIVEHRPAHEREHSLEMQLPFIARLLAGVPIVPMVMGYQSRETAFGLGDALARVMADASDPPLLVASSDLSHFEDAHVAARMDRIVLEHVEQLDADGLMLALETTPNHACGGGPMVAVLHAARQAGATGARVLKYGDSGDVTGDKSSVVGYMAAAIW
jgi:AmmeMemoRadiSam system protein B